MVNVILLPHRMVYHADRFPDYPHIVFGDGDGTVNARSMRHCLKVSYLLTIISVNARSTPLL